MMDNIKGTLIHGLMHEGEIQKDFEIRPSTAGDLCKLYDDRQLVEQHGHNQMYMDVALIAICLEKLGNIPKGKICPALLMQLSEMDAALLLRAARRMLRAGTGDSGQPLDADAGADEAGL